MESCREQGQQLFKVWRTGVREDQRLEQRKEEKRGPMALEEELLCPLVVVRQPPRELQAGRESIAECRAHCLSASEKEVEGCQDQILEVEFCVGVVFILKMREMINRLTIFCLHLVFSLCIR